MSSVVLVAYWGYIGIMEKKMEAIILTGCILGLFWVYIGVT